MFLREFASDGLELGWGKKNKSSQTDLLSSCKIINVGPRLPKFAFPISVIQRILEHHGLHLLWVNDWTAWWSWKFLVVADVRVKLAIRWYTVVTFSAQKSGVSCDFLTWARNFSSSILSWCVCSRYFDEITHFALWSVLMTISVQLCSYTEETCWLKLWLAFTEEYDFSTRFCQGVQSFFQFLRWRVLNTQHKQCLTTKNNNKNNR